MGWNAWEEIDRIPNPTAGVLDFGWPCYEGAGRQSGYDGTNLSVCESLYGRPGAVRAPYYTYDHGSRVVPGESCPSGSSSISGLAFYASGRYPTTYNGTLFFADYSRDCIWAMRAGTNGLPDPTQRTTFAAGAANPVQLTIGPAGDLFYVDYDGGRIRRIRYFLNNQPPVAVIQADRTYGPTPLTVTFSGAASTDPNPNDILSYAWDLDGDGQFDDSFASEATWTYVSAGNVTVRLQVTDSFTASDTETVVISAGNTPPRAEILTPLPSLRWRAGQTVTFSGRALDDEQGTLPASALLWTVVLQHCPSDCHEHILQEFPGTGGASITAPDHDFPSYLELRLRATDVLGLQHTASLWLSPLTVDLTFTTQPAGGAVTVGPTTEKTPFVRRVIVGSNNSMSAPDSFVLFNRLFRFHHWSDGGDQSHNFTAPETAATFTAFCKQDSRAGLAER